MDDDNKKKVVDLFKSSIKPAEAASNVIYINGKGNIVGDGNTVIHANTIIHRPKVQVKTGDGVITAEQKSRLTLLLKDWIAKRSAVRKTVMTHAAAWAAVNKQAKVNSYHEIPAEKFELVEKWLIKQISIIHSMPSAPVKIKDWRVTTIGKIHGRCKKLGIDDARKVYMEKTFGKDSLTLLTDDQVDKVYRWSLGKR